MGKTILVTGGAGFIGSHLAKKLMDLGSEVIIVDNFNSYYELSLKERRISEFLAGYKFKLYKAEITDSENLRKIFEENKIDTICHLASQAGVRHSIEHPFEHERANISGTLNLLELAKDFKIGRFIFVSSGSVYGNAKMPYSEEKSKEMPISPYGVTKRAAELFGYSYHITYNLPVTVLRYFNVYGPWGRPDAAYFKFTKNIIEGKSIDVYNFGKMKRTFSYIDDIVAGTIAAINKNFPCEIFNLGNDRQIDLNYFIECIEKNLGIQAKKNYLPLQAGDLVEVQIDISKAKKMLNFQPKIEVEEGIRRFVEWYKNYYKI